MTAFRHTDVIARAAELVDRLVIGIGVHPRKAPMFSDDERVALLEANAEPIADEAGIEIEIVTFSNLVVTAARENGANAFFVVFATARTRLRYEMAGMNDRWRRMCKPCSSPLRRVSATSRQTSCARSRPWAATSPASFPRRWPTLKAKIAANGAEAGASP